VSITCEFCGRSWRFEPADVERLFTSSLPVAAERSLN
jgi:hypothetical protein